MSLNGFAVVDLVVGVGLCLHTCGPQAIHGIQTCEMYGDPTSRVWYSRFSIDGYFTIGLEVWMAATGLAFVISLYLIQTHSLFSMFVN